VLSGCRQDMHDQPKYRPLQLSGLFSDNRSERPLLPGTVARGFLRADEGAYTGKVNGQAITTFPFPVTKEVLIRGQERFNIYCSPCHSRTGDGNGMIVQRGFSHPPSYHTDRLRNAPVGHFFDVITNGFGAMQSYAARVEPQDRWAIIAYVRALQVSRNARAADVPADKQAELAAAPDTGPQKNPEQTGSDTGTGLEKQPSAAKGTGGAQPNPKQETK
jgi:mono/diheme cytochrome c family protein